MTRALLEFVVLTAFFAVTLAWTLIGEILLKECLQ